MPDEQLRVGIVGCGYQGGRLAEAIGLGDSFVVAACADTDMAVAAKLATSRRRKARPRRPSTIY